VFSDDNAANLLILMARVNGDETLTPKLSNLLVSTAAFYLCQVFIATSLLPGHVAVILLLLLPHNSAATCGIYCDIILYLFVCPAVFRSFAFV